MELKQAATLCSLCLLCSVHAQQTVYQRPINQDCVTPSTQSTDITNYFPDDLLVVGEAFQSPDHVTVRHAVNDSTLRLCRRFISPFLPACVTLLSQQFLAERQSLMQRKICRSCNAGILRTRLSGPILQLLQGVQYLCFCQKDRGSEVFNMINVFIAIKDLLQAVMTCAGGDQFNCK